MQASNWSQLVQALHALLAQAVQHLHCKERRLSTAIPSAPPSARTCRQGRARLSAGPAAGRSG